MIAICDDQTSELKRLSEIIKAYMHDRSFDMEVHLFSHPDQLLDSVDTNAFDIYLLDIVMPMINGLNVAKRIRQVNLEAQIIFITSEPGYALEAYSVNPLHYLVKPIQIEALFDVLDLAVKKLEQIERKTITVKTKSGFRTLFINQIAYCEYKNHVAYYTLIDGEQIKTSTISCGFMKHISPLLEDGRFLSPHVSYVLNMNRVERLAREGFYLSNQIFIPISARHYTTVRDAYLQFRLSKEG